MISFERSYALRASVLICSLALRLSTADFPECEEGEICAKPYSRPKAYADVCRCPIVVIQDQRGQRIRQTYCHARQGGDYPGRMVCHVPRRGVEPQFRCEIDGRCGIVVRRPGPGGIGGAETVEITEFCNCAQASRRRACREDRSFTGDFRNGENFYAYCRYDRDYEYRLRMPDRDNPDYEVSAWRPPVLQQCPAADALCWQNRPELTIPNSDICVCMQGTACIAFDRFLTRIHCAPTVTHGQLSDCSSNGRRCRVGGRDENGPTACETLCRCPKGQRGVLAGSDEYGFCASNQPPVEICTEINLRHCAEYNLALKRYVDVCRCPEGQFCYGRHPCLPGGLPYPPSHTLVCKVPQADTICNDPATRCGLLADPDQGIPSIDFYRCENAMFNECGGNLADGPYKHCGDRARNYLIS